MSGREPESEGPVSLLRLLLRRWRCSARPLAMRAVGGPVGQSSRARAAPPHGQTDPTLLSFPRKCPNDVHAGLASAQAPAPAASGPSYIPLALEDLLPLTPRVILGLSRPRLSSPPRTQWAGVWLGRRLWSPKPGTVPPVSRLFLLCLAMSFDSRMQLPTCCELLPSLQVSLPHSRLM